MKKIVYGFSVIIIPLLLFMQSFTQQQEPEDKAALGKQLFFDPILSKDRTISCASCHKPAFAFADTSAVSKGVYGRTGNRNSPTVMNIRQQLLFFWDGRAASMEEQVLQPIENPDEMDLSVDSAVQRLTTDRYYRQLFEKIFHETPTRQHLASAIAAFERTLETSQSAFDHWKFSEDTNAVSNAVKNGFIVFNKKGKCIQCHFGSDFTQNEFRNIGLFNGLDLNDSGRVIISGKKEDIGKFKTPTLRNIAVTAPYMHNGMFTTLEEVIEFYNDPGKVVSNGINRDSILSSPLGLTIEEKHDLKQFLLSLTDQQFINKKQINNK